MDESKIGKTVNDLKNTETQGTWSQTRQLHDVTELIQWAEFTTAAQQSEGKKKKKKEQMISFTSHSDTLFIIFRLN